MTLIVTGVRDGQGMSWIKTRTAGMSELLVLAANQKRETWPGGRRTWGFRAKGRLGPGLAEQFQRVSPLRASSAALRQLVWKVKCPGFGWLWP